MLRRLVSTVKLDTQNSFRHQIFTGFGRAASRSLIFIRGSFIHPQLTLAMRAGRKGRFFGKAFPPFGEDAQMSCVLTNQAARLAQILDGVKGGIYGPVPPGAISGNRLFMCAVSK